ncbi:MAG: hypothetical protein ACP5IV_07425 [Caldisericia bacterium]
MNKNKKIKILIGTTLAFAIVSIIFSLLYTMNNNEIYHLIQKTNTIYTNKTISVPVYINKTFTITKTLTIYKNETINQTKYALFEPLVIVSGSLMFSNLSFTNNALQYSIYSNFYNATMIKSELSNNSKITIFLMPNSSYKITNIGEMPFIAISGSKFFCGSNPKYYENTLLNTNQTATFPSNYKYIMLIPIPSNAPYTQSIIMNVFNTSVQNPCLNKTILNLNSIYGIV